MAKRLLDCTASDFAKMHRTELFEAIRASEGRVIAAETIGTIQPMLHDVTNAEFAASMGADLLILNMYDVQHPQIQALPKTAPEDTIRELKRLTGRPVGINLEPVSEKYASEVDTTDLWKLTPGRAGTPENAAQAIAQGVDFIVLTGNPGIGVDNDAICHALSAIRAQQGDRILLIAGKMHAAGILEEAAENILTPQEVEAFCKAGADVILLPAPGTVPGITQEYAKQLIACAHSHGALAMTTIGTSQEGADTATIRQIALMCKMAGADIHHLGDAGYGGVSLPENILAYSMAIRGVRHTYHRMAVSVNR